MKRERVRIGLDFDDTLMPTRDAMIELLNARHGTSFRPGDCTEVAFTHRWQMTRQDYIGFFTEHEAAIHTRQPYVGVVETLQAWGRVAELYVITGRPECWKESAETWLARHGIAVEGVICTDSGLKKSGPVKKLGLTFFIDDRPDFVADIAAAGVPVLLLDAPYNQGYSHTLVERVRDWEEIRGIVEKRRYLELSTV